MLSKMNEEDVLDYTGFAKLLDMVEEAKEKIRNYKKFSRLLVEALKNVKVD